MKKKRRYIFMTSIFMQVFFYICVLFFIWLALFDAIRNGWKAEHIFALIFLSILLGYSFYSFITTGLFFDFEEDIVVISLGLFKKDRVVRVISDIKSIEIERAGGGADFFVIHTSGLTERFHCIQRGDMWGLQLKRIKRELSKCIPSNIDDAA